MFHDGAHSPTMVKHGMNIIKQVTVRINPGQIPVTTVDLPIYSITQQQQQNQWTWPDEYGERKYVVLMGHLHIEMAMLVVIGDWLDGSDWTYVMTSANITTEGRALGLEKGSHIQRSMGPTSYIRCSVYSSSQVICGVS